MVIFLYSITRQRFGAAPNTLYLTEPETPVPKSPAKADKFGSVVVPLLASQVKGSEPFKPSCTTPLELTENLEYLEPMNQKSKPIFATALPTSSRLAPNNCVPVDMSMALPFMSRTIDAFVPVVKE